MGAEDKAPKDIFYTFDDITLSSFIKVNSGDLTALSKDGKIYSESVNAYYHIQDGYILMFGGDSPEMKRYKWLITELCLKIKEWFNKPEITGQLVGEINDLFMQKEQVSKALFHPTEKLDYNELIASFTLKTKITIDKRTMLAKDFFYLIKEIQNQNGKD